jgi:hypothetical protein
MAAAAPDPKKKPKKVILIDIDGTAILSCDEFTIHNVFLMRWLQVYKKVLEKDFEVEFALFSARFLETYLSYNYIDFVKHGSKIELVYTIEKLKEIFKSFGIDIVNLFSVADLMSAVPGRFYEDIKEVETALMVKGSALYLPELHETAYEKEKAQLERRDSARRKVIRAHHHRLQTEDGIFLKSGLLRQIIEADMAKNPGQEISYLIIDDNVVVCEDLCTAPELKPFRVILEMIQNPHGLILSLSKKHHEVYKPKLPEAWEAFRAELLASAEAYPLEKISFRITSLADTDAKIAAVFIKPGGEKTSLRVIESKSGSSRTLRDAEDAAGGAGAAAGAGKG